MSGIDSSVDEALRLIADGRRRRVLHTLRESDGTVTVTAIVDRIVAAERDVTDGSVAPRSVRTSLHHVHLPKLAAAGVVEFDVESGEVRYRPDETVEDVLTAVEEAL
jgi:DNA-binding transcriptional ArsR family regulator